jgi:hypothetical protein
LEITITSVTVVFSIRINFQSLRPWSENADSHSDSAFGLVVTSRDSAFGPVVTGRNTEFSYVVTCQASMYSPAVERQDSANGLAIVQSM